MEVRTQPKIATSSAPKTKLQKKPLRWTSLPAALRYGILLAIFVGVWQAYITFGNVSSALVASPADVLGALFTDIANFTIPNAAINTLQTLVVGLLIGTALGLALATFAVLSSIGQDILSLLSAVFNPLPSIAILPLAMIWFGPTSAAIIFVVVHATMWPIALNIDTGFRTISPTIQMAARNLGLRGISLVREVYIPAAMPYLITGLKSAWAFGWRTVVAAELVFGSTGNAGGLGWYINNSRYFLATPAVFAGLLVISILGVLIEMVFWLVEKRTVVRWGMKKTVQ